MQLINEKNLFVIKTDKGYLKGSKSSVGGSEPAFTDNISEALLLTSYEIELKASYHCIKNYTVVIK
jgi:hypothetical protein